MKYYWAPLLFFLFAYLLPLGVRPMVTPDEFRYAEIPREMIERGNWVTPTLLQMRYFEKPALGYQLTAASFRVFGENAFALRLPAALAAGLTSLLILLFLQRYTGEDRIAALGALLYLACGMVYGVGTFAVLDSQTTLFVTGTLVCLLPACLEPKFNRVKIFLLAMTGVFAGLAFLTKGFLAFAVPGVVVLPFLIWERRWKDLLVLPWIPLAAMLAVAAPWAWLIHRQEPDFWRYFTIVEHWQRFTAETEGQHPEPFYYFVPALVLGMLPAGLLLPCAVAGLRARWAELKTRSFIRYSICYLVFPFLFFSASSGKLATYILPCFVPLAILGAVGIAAYFRQGGECRLFHYLCRSFGGLLIAAALLAAGGRLLIPFFRPSLLEAAWMPPWYWLAPAILAVLLWGGYLAAAGPASWRNRLAAFFAGMVGVVICGNLVITPDAMGDKTPEHGLAELRPLLPPDAVLIVHRSMTHAVAWCYRRPDLTMLISAGEFKYGLSYPDGRGRLISLDDYNRLVRRADRPPVAYLCGADSKDYLKPGAPVPRVHRAAGVKLLIFPSPAVGERKSGER